MKNIQENTHVTSNYDITKRACAQTFCASDHTRVVEQFGLSHDADYWYLTFFQQPFRVSKHTGVVERHTNIKSAKADADKSTHNVACTTWEEAEFNESMCVYDLLTNAQPNCCASNCMVNMQSLHTQIAAAAPSSGGFYRKQEAHLAHVETQHPGTLQRAMTTLGGAPLNKADVSSQFIVFDTLAMQIHLWLADEDFPASLQLFWDKNVLQYLHYETVWYANGFILDLLTHALKQGAFN